MSNKSFSILRTNTLLTGNSKIMVSRDGLYIESISSPNNPILSESRFKKFSIRRDSLYDEVLPVFYKNVPNDVIYHVKYDNDNDIMYSDFSEQYDDTYSYGVKTISNIEDYNEKYEYFAPLYIKDILPEFFIIFRSDGSDISNSNRENFTSFLDTLKVVEVIPLNNDTRIGYWLNNNFISNDIRKDKPLYINLNKMEMCKWSGFNIKKGGYSTISIYMDNILSIENELFELDKYITEVYKNNNLIYPNIINLSFLFNDDVNDKNDIWKFNRYSGFYIDSLDEIKRLSPYITKDIVTDFTIEDNYIIPSDNVPIFGGEWNDSDDNIIEYRGVFYNIERVIDYTKNELDKVNKNKRVDLSPTIKKGSSLDDIKLKPKSTNKNFYIEEYNDVIYYKYKIISDINITNANEINKGYIRIGTDNILYNRDGSYFIIESEYYDVYLIKMGDVYARLLKQEDKMIVLSDYIIIDSDDRYVLINNGNETSILKRDGDNAPLTFTLFGVNFTDIKDFDTKIVDTDYSTYEYEYKDNLLNSEMGILPNLIDSNSNPKEMEEFVFNGERTIIPVSSEYIPNYELFKHDIVNGNHQLTDLWRINPVYSRWAFEESISSNDKPYIFNNSLILENFNRTTNIYSNIVSKFDRNLDYFYMVNTKANVPYNSLSIESYNDDGSINTNFHFDKSKYLSNEIDYFTEFFNTEYKSDGKLFNREKYSLLVSDITNNTLFRGINFNFMKVRKKETTINNEVSKILTKPTTDLDNYKFSILLNNTIDDTEGSAKLVYIYPYDFDVEYKIGDHVIYDDIIYKKVESSNDNNFIEFNIGNETHISRSNPMRNGYILAHTDVHWNPDTLHKIVYHHGIYYIKTTIITKSNELTFEQRRDHKTNANLIRSVIGEFWNPYKAYEKNSIVKFKNRWYKSILSNNYYYPDENGWEEHSGVGVQFNWSEIPPYSKINNGISQNIVIYNNNIYINVGGVQDNLSPDISNNWELYYTIDLLSDFEYSGVGEQPFANTGQLPSINNMIVNIDGNLAYILPTTSGQTYNHFFNNNGVNVYFNHKYKNILFEIEISDNTYYGIEELNRIDMYNLPQFNKITSGNIVNYINDVNNLYGFSRPIRYITINDDVVEGSDFILKVGYPNTLYLNKSSLIVEPLSNINIKVNKALRRGIINDLSSLNNYSGIITSASLRNSNIDLKIIPNYYSVKNNTKNVLYRYNGSYEPLFYKIELFKSGSDKNTKFNTDLYNFGIQKDRLYKKVNRTGNILKLYNRNDVRSIYPMLHEFGYSFGDFYIFKSNWDTAYYTEVSKYINELSLSKKISDNMIKIDNIGILRK